MSYNQYGGYGQQQAPSYHTGTPAPHGGYQQQQPQYQQYAPPPGNPSYGGQHGGGHHGGGGASFAPPPSRQPQNSNDQQLWQWFLAVDTDRSGQISVPELQRALVNGDWAPFDLDTVKLLMKTFDTKDRNGSIGFEEFRGLWDYIQQWQQVFRYHDSDGSGSISQDELARALASFQINAPRLLPLIVQKYSSEVVSAYGGPPPSISFDRFIRCCVALRYLQESFNRKVQLQQSRDGRVSLTYEELMEIFLNAP